MEELKLEPYLEKLFANTNDFDLIHRLFVRIATVCDASKIEDLQRLPEPQRIALEVWGASGMIGNGGFRYLFESNFADFNGLSDALESINSFHAARAVRNAIGLFPNSRPHAAPYERIAYLDQLGAPALKKLNECSHEIWDADRETRRLLAVYVRSHQSDFANLKPTPQEIIGEQKAKELSPPSPGADEDSIVLWLRSIGATVVRWSDVSESEGSSPLVKPNSGNPICEIRLGRHRNSTDTEIELLLKYDSLKYLQIMDLSGTCVTIDGLRRLQSLPILQKLQLIATDVRNDWLSTLISLPALKDLNLSRTQISDDGLEAIGDIQTLRTLDLPATKVQGHGLVALTRLPDLTRLNLFGCPLVDVRMLPISGLINLKSLELGATAVGDGTLEKAGTLTELKYLGLSSTQITDHGLTYLTRLNKLQALYLECVQVEGQGLEDISKLRQLQTLNLYQTNVNDAAIGHIANLVNLNSLVLSETQLQGGSALIMLDRLQSLEKLCLPSRMKKGNANVDHLRRVLPNTEFSFL